MKMHYLVSISKLACGAHIHSEFTSWPERVTCADCLLTDAWMRASNDTEASRFYTAERERMRAVFMQHAVPDRDDMETAYRTGYNDGYTRRQAEDGLRASRNGCAK